MYTPAILVNTMDTTMTAVGHQFCSRVLKNWENRLG